MTISSVRSALLLFTLVGGCSSGESANPAGVGQGTGVAQPGPATGPAGPAKAAAPGTDAGAPEAPPTADEIPARYDLVRDHLRLGRKAAAMSELQRIAKAGAAAREILTWARDDEDLVPLRDSPEYQRLMYPDGERPAGQVPVSRLYALGGPARLTHHPEGPVLTLPGLPAPPTEGDRLQPVRTPGWAAFKELLSGTRAITTREQRVYQPAATTRNLDVLPLAVRQGGVSQLSDMAWWRPRDDVWLLVVPYQLAGEQGGLGVALYAPVERGIQLAAASGEIPLQCPGHQALLFTTSLEEIRLVSGCHAATLTVCRLRWEAGAIRSTCQGVPDEDLPAAATP